MIVFFSLLATVLLREFSAGLHVSNRISVVSNLLKNGFVRPAYVNAYNVRQTCTLSLNYPQRCLDDLDNAEVLLAKANPEDDEAIIIPTLNIALESICRLECVDPAVDYLRCLGAINIADMYLSALCGQQEGKYCHVRLLAGVGDSQIAMDTSCGTSGSCNASCRHSLQATADYLGCCAPSLFENPEIADCFLSYRSLDFSTCGVSLGEMCSPASVVRTVELEYMCSSASTIEVTKGLLRLIASIIAVYLSIANLFRTWSSFALLVKATAAPEETSFVSIAVEITTGLALFIVSVVTVILSSTYFVLLCLPH